jgi:DNA-binding Xre family transcriptional regulator
MKGPMIKWNLRLEALCNFGKCFVSDIILYLMNSREKTLGVKKIGNR